MARSTIAKIGCVREFWKQNCNDKRSNKRIRKGLDESGVKFLWVLKAKIVDKDDGEGLEEMVGDSLIERTKHTGLVIKGWVNQKEILSHPAICGFVSHCGWNSVMEEAARGMPLLAWPQIGDQKVNAEVVEAARLGVWDKSWGWLGERLVKGEEIAKMVKMVMCDENLRGNARKIREEGMNETRVGGSSYKVIPRFEYPEPRKMGMKATTLLPGPINNQDAFAAQYQLIDYVSKQFFVRRLVSQNRRRMLVGGYDLDMSYITPRILAMSFPAERMKAIYRNPMWQVKDVLEMRHKGHYKVCNLCIEEDYDPSHFNNLVERFPFDDNHVPSLQMIKELCESVGKGRTGLMVSSYLTYTGMLAEEAPQVYADKRTTNNLEGMLHINICWIYATVSYLRYRPSRNICRNFCKKVNDVGIVNLGHFYSFLEEDHEGHNSEIEGSDENSSYDFYFDERIKVNGDLCVTFYEKNIGGRLFYACFNTAFIENKLLHFRKFFGCYNKESVDDTEEPEESVGDLFIERPKHKGMVVKGWVTEEETISHTAIGAFVSHSGWNSAMEASARGNHYLAWL
ncbi:phosphatidylinositol 3,4,5-trisphosphate 3-phosphatase and protein-tyrosine-phosphatase PTEN1 isoform X2 [Tanacetum coccineum]